MKAVVHSYLPKNFNHEPILNLSILVPRPCTQHGALIRNLLTDNRRPAEEDSDFDFIALLAVLFVEPIRQNLAHVFVVLLHDGLDVWTPEMCRVDKAGDGRSRMFIRAVLLKEPAENMLGYLLALLRHIRVDAYVEISTFGLLARHLIQEVGEPQEIILIAHHPVEVNTAVVVVWRILLATFIRAFLRAFDRLYAFELVVLEVGKHTRKGSYANTGTTKR